MEYLLSRDTYQFLTGARTAISDFNNSAFLLRLPFSAPVCEEIPGSVAQLAQTSCAFFWRIIFED